MIPSRRSFSAGLGLAAAAALTLAAFAADGARAADTGAPAPGFTAETAAGETISLSDFAGQTVILEWTNHDCPYVKKHYDGTNMQALQARAADEGVTWIQIISSAPGKQGHVSAERALALNDERGAEPTHVILDESGDIGRAYEARTTPHMYLIDEAGVLRYAGAIDDRNSADPASLEGATNYVTLAMDATAAGEAIDPDRTAPYGCSVKY